jgi:RNA polymerase sigma-70 factor, ECF subfamily
MGTAVTSMAVDEVRPVRAEDGRALAEACQRGDPEALRTLYEQHHAAVARVVRLYGPTTTEADEDLVHDTFVTALEKLPGFRGESSLQTWLRGIALNVARSRRAKLGRRRRLLDRQPPLPLSASDQIETQADSRRALARLCTLLERLPQVEREAFVMRRVERLSLDEVAAQTRSPISTVGDRVNRAERTLRAWLEEEQR